MKKTINNSRIPLFRDSGFYLSDIDTTKKAFELEKEIKRDTDIYIYSRYRNPNVVEAENQIITIEQSAWALLTQSGMAAIDLALSIFEKGNNTGKWLFFSEIYGGTNSYIELVLKQKRGRDIEHFYSKNGKYDLTELELILDKIKPELIYFEAVSNPMLIVADVKKIIKLAKSRNIKIIVDNTFATPKLWKPLNDGADLVIHSVTKYLAGHGNLTAGVLCGNNPQFEKDAIEYRKWIGHTISADDAYRLSDYLKTFDLRFEKHCQNAFKVANFLEQHSQIEKVFYPGLKSHSTYNEAVELFADNGFGGMVTFDIKGDNNEEKFLNCNNFIYKVAENIALIPSLGDVETTLIPIEAVWGQKYPFPGMIRLSVGIENSDKIISVLKNGLNF